MKLFPFVAVSLAGFSVPAAADVCDYKPSKFSPLAATTIVGGATAGSGAVMSAAGFYTLVHAGSGLTMVGSTAAGASAAGTAGIIAGTRGFVGTVGSILMPPVTIVLGATALATGSAFEGACMFAVERVTDAAAVRGILESVAENDDSVSIVRMREGPALQIVSATGPTIYPLENL